MKFGATRREHPADQAAGGIVGATCQGVAPTWRVEEPGTIPRLCMSLHTTKNLFVKDGMATGKANKGPNRVEKAIQTGE